MKCSETKWANPQMLANLENNNIMLKMCFMSYRKFTFLNILTIIYDVMVFSPF